MEITDLDIPYQTTGIYQDILDSAKTSITINEGILKIIGKPGVGKTALCLELYKQLQTDELHVVFFSKAPSSIDELEKIILRQLNIQTQQTFSFVIQNYLQRNNEKLLLIYDDAENLSDEIYLAIKLLNNIQTDRETLVKQVLCGGPDLETKLRDRKYRHLTQYFSDTIYVDPLTLDELTGIAETMMSTLASQLGTEKTIEDQTIPEKEIKNIFRATRGLPAQSFTALLEYIHNLQPSTDSGEENSRRIIAENQTPILTEQINAKVEEETQHSPSARLNSLYQPTDEEPEKVVWLNHQRQIIAACIVAVVILSAGFYFTRPDTNNSLLKPAELAVTPVSDEPINEVLTNAVPKSETRINTEQGIIEQNDNPALERKDNDIAEDLDESEILVAVIDNTMVESELAENETGQIETGQN